MEPRSMVVSILALTFGCSGQLAGNGASTSAPDIGGLPDNGGLPCDVDSVLATRCRACHSSPPIGGATVPLITHANLSAPSRTDPSLTEAQLAVARMKSTTLPMPPAPASPVPAPEIAIIEGWIAAGQPTGTCMADAASADGAGNPYDTPIVCTSGLRWTGRASRSMAPGDACISCHQRSPEAPQFALSGTVYPTAHEPIDCNGITGSTAVTVVVVDATGATVMMQANSVGNFYASAALTPPYRAKVMSAVGERVMTTPQTSGDCNSCHTQDGANGAPGRIMAP